MNLSLLILKMIIEYSMAFDCSRIVKYEQKGDVYVIGLYPVNFHSPSKFDISITLWMEKSKETIDIINRALGQNVFGYIFYDTGGVESNDLSVCAVTDLLLDVKNFKKLSIGVVGPYQSSLSELIHNLLSAEKITIVSYGSTSVELSDKLIYPNFFRVVPPDTIQGNFIGKIVHKNGWNFVSIIAADTIYGRAGLEITNNRLKMLRICLAVERLLSIPLQKSLIIEAIKKLHSYQRSNVIILWGGFSTVKEILLEAYKLKLLHKTWIFTEASGQNVWFFEMEKLLNATFLIITQTSGRDIKFENKIHDTQFNDLSKSPWFQRTTDTNDISMTDLKKKLDFSRVGCVRNANLALITSFLNFKNHECLKYGCNFQEFAQHYFDRKIFQQNFVKNVTFNGLVNESIEFDKNQDVKTSIFELYVIKNKEFKISARWVSGYSLQLFPNTIPMTTSNCSEACLPGFYTDVNPIHKCCWKCIKCSKGYIKPNSGHGYCHKCANGYTPNNKQDSCIYRRNVTWNIYVEFFIFGATAVFSITVVITMSLFIKYRSNRIVRASNYPLSLLQMSTHLLHHLINFLHIGEETYLKCIVREYVGQFTFTSILSLIFIRITHIRMVFKAKTRLTKEDVNLNNTKEILIIVVASLVYICLCACVYFIEPITIQEIVNLKENIKYKKCTKDIFNHVIAAYDALILVACATQSVRSIKHVHSIYNESKYIAFSMFFTILIYLVSVPLQASIRQTENKRISNSILTIFNGFIIFAFLFLVKAYWIISKKKHKELDPNRRVSIRQHRSATVMRSL